MSLGTKGFVNRDSRWSQVEANDFDIVIIGGGISGASLFARMSSEGIECIE